MEINVTTIVNDALNFDIDSMQFSASAMELGQDAGKITWNNCMEYVESLEGPDRLVVLPSELQEARDHFEEYGAWSEEEILAWTDQELNAMLFQEVMAGVREIEYYDTWEEWLQAWEDGQCSGRLCGEVGGEWHLYIGV